MLQTLIQLFINQAQTITNINFVLINLNLKDSTLKNKKKE